MAESLGERLLLLGCAWLCDPSLLLFSCFWCEREHSCGALADFVGFDLLEVESPLSAEFPRSWDVVGYGLFPDPFGGFIPPVSKPLSCKVCGHGDHSAFPVMCWM